MKKKTVKKAKEQEVVQVVHGDPVERAISEASKISPKLKTLLIIGETHEGAPVAIASSGITMKDLAYLKEICSSIRMADKNG